MESWEYNDVINGSCDVINILNKHVINMAADIGQENNIEHNYDVNNTINNYVIYESIVLIQTNQRTDGQFDLNHVSAGENLNETLQ